MGLLRWAAVAATAGALALPLGITSARAEPFYGYSGYFGGPAVYYTAHPDIQQSTTPRGGVLGFGVRTYTTGGPFWRYKSTARGLHRRHHREVVRVRG